MKVNQHNKEHRQQRRGAGRVMENVREGFNVWPRRIEVWPEDLMNRTTGPETILMAEKVLKVQSDKDDQKGVRALAMNSELSSKPQGPLNSCGSQCLKTQCGGERQRQDCLGLLSASTSYSVSESCLKGKRPRAIEQDICCLFCTQV